MTAILIVARVSRMRRLYTCVMLWGNPHNYEPSYKQAALFYINHAVNCSSTDGVAVPMHNISGVRAAIITNDERPMLSSGSRR